MLSNDIWNANTTIYYFSISQATALYFAITDEEYLDACAQIIKFRGLFKRPYSLLFVKKNRAPYSVHTVRYVDQFTALIV